MLAPFSPFCTVVGTAQNQASEPVVFQRQIKACFASAFHPWLSSQGALDIVCPGCLRPWHMLSQNTSACGCTVLLRATTSQGSECLVPRGYQEGPCPHQAQVIHSITSAIHQQMVSKQLPSVRGAGRRAALMGLGLTPPSPVSSSVK